MTETLPISAEPRPAVARTLVPGAAMIAVSFGLARYGYGLLLPEMRADLHLGAGTAGLIASGTYVSYLLANVGVVALTDRWGARWAVGLAAACAALGMGVLALAASPLALAVGVLLAGAASGLAYPPYAGMVAHEVPPARRDAVWSAISSGTGWGVALAGPLAIVAGERWRLAWGLFVLIAVAVGASATLLAPRRVDRDEATRPRLSWSWFVCPRSRPLLVSAVLVGAGSAVWWAFSVDALREAGLGATPARVVYAVCGAAGILASLSGAVFERVGLRRGYLACAGLVALALVLLQLAHGALGPALLAAVLFGVCYNGVIAAQGIWSARVFVDHPAAGLAAVNAALTVGTLAGPTLAGWGVGRFGYPTVLLGAGLVLLLALPFSPPTSRRRVTLEEHRDHCRAVPARR